MRQFLTLLSKFFIPVIFLNLLLFIQWNKGFKTYANNLNDNFVHKTFIFADSHGKCLNRDAAIFNVHNLSYASDNYEDIRKKIEFLIAQRVTIDTIVLTVDPHTLSPYRASTNNNKYSDGLQNSVSKYLPIINAPFTTSLPRILEWNILSYFNKESEISSWQNKSKSEKEKAALSRLKKQFPNDQVSPQLRRELLEIISICKEHNIRLFGIRFPVASEYAILVQKNDYGAQNVCLQNGITILNYQNRTVFSDTLFEDEDHLNNDGGLVLHKLLKNDLTK